MILAVGYADAQEPKAVVELWQNALFDGDLKIASKYTSSTSAEYLSARFGSLEGLSQRYQVGKQNYLKTIYEEQKINGDIARVIYTTYYRDGSIKRWEDTLFREGGVWKVAPQFARVTEK